MNGVGARLEQLRRTLGEMLYGMTVDDTVRDNLRVRRVIEHTWSIPSS